MSDKYKATDIDKAYYVTITVTDWVDLFTRKRYKEIVVDSLKYCQRKLGLEIYAWCLMSSHLHMMCSSLSEKILYEIIQRFKMFTTKTLLASIQEGPESRREWLMERFAEPCKNIKKKQNYKLWRHGYHAKELRSNDFIYQKLEYIHNNPVDEGIVTYAEDYVYCSAPAYAGKEGLLDVVVLPARLRAVR